MHCVIGIGIALTSPGFPHTNSEMRKKERENQLRIIRPFDQKMINSIS